MGHFAFSVDWRVFSSDLDLVSGRLQAIRDTVAATGTGEVVVSARKKLPGEKAKAIHGMMVANLLRKIGHDPFDYPADVAAEVEEFISTEIEELVQIAYRTGRPQRSAAQRVFMAAATELAKAATNRVETGGLGETVGDYGRYKARRRKAGTLPPESKYVGIKTGRFVAGIRPRRRRGRRT